MKIGGVDENRKNLYNTIFMNTNEKLGLISVNQSRCCIETWKGKELSSEENLTFNKEH